MNSENNDVQADMQLFFNAKHYAEVIEGYGFRTPQYQFCRAFVRTLNQQKRLASALATGKLEIAENKKEKTVGFLKAVVTDVLGFFNVPTNALGVLADEVTTAVLQGYRYEGYKRSAGYDIHQTHVELLSQTLAFALMIHYHESANGDLVNPDDKPARRGQRAAKRLASAMKYTENLLDENTTLLERVNPLLEYIIGNEVIRKKEGVGDTGALAFTQDDIQTLMAFSSARLLNLKLSHFVDSTMQARVITELHDITQQHELRIQALERRQPTSTITVTGNLKRTDAAFQLASAEMTEDASAEIKASTAEMLAIMNQQFMDVQAKMTPEQLAAWGVAKKEAEPNIVVKGNMLQISAVGVAGTITILPKKNKEKEKEEELELEALALEQELC